MPDMRLPAMGENEKGKHCKIQKEGTCVRKKNHKNKGNGFGGIEEKGLPLALEKEGGGRILEEGIQNPAKRIMRGGEMTWNGMTCVRVYLRKKRKKESCLNGS